MKTRILRFVNHTFTYICFGSLIVEIFLLLFFSDAAARHPHGALDRLNISLIITFFVSLVIIIFMGNKWDEPTPPEVKKPRRKRKNAPLRIFLFGHYVKVRPNFFWILGIFCGIYFVLSGKLFPNIQEFNRDFKWCTIWFIPAYIFLYKIISALFFKKPKDFDYMTYNGFTWRDDVEMYLIGALGGIVVAFIIKGVLWLINYPIVIFTIILLVIFFLVIIKNKSKK